MLDDAEKQPDPEAALLGMTACDPAIGSGHLSLPHAASPAGLPWFRTGEIHPTPNHAAGRMQMLDVVAGRINGVDINPMASCLGLRLRSGGS